MRIRVLAGVLALAAVAPAPAAAATDLLPDLVADAPTRPLLDYYTYSGGGQDLLLRFDGHVHNAGAGAFDVRGARATSDVPIVPLQRVYDSDGAFRDDAMPNAQLFYSNADGHNHFHLQDMARYSLWNSAKSAEVAPALKVGFCLEDTAHVDDFGPEEKVYTDAAGRDFCERNQPNSLELFEGVSSGWRDIYPRTLALQWVVASEVRPGSYWLRSDIDPTSVVHESNETNAPAWSSTAITIPGHVAKPLALPPAPYGQQQELTLGATTFGSPGARRYRIVTPPAHGSLDVETGVDLTDASVAYTPDEGFAGPDQFTYEALDSTSPYPIHPVTATVALSVGAQPVPRVVIDTAPTGVETGHGVQLHATVTNDIAGVVWSVNGIDGGSAATGTITPGGFYSAPALIPPPGRVTIRARSSSGAYDQRVVAITLPPTPPRSPMPADPRYVPGKLLSTITRTLDGNVLAASVKPTRAGVVSIAASVGDSRLGSCRAEAPEGRRFTCRVNVPHGLGFGLGLGKLKLVAKLRRGGKLVATVSRSGAPPVR